MARNASLVPGSHRNPAAPPRSGAQCRYPGAGGWKTSHCRGAPSATPITAAARAARKAISSALLTPAALPFLRRLPGSRGAPGGMSWGFARAGLRPQLLVASWVRAFRGSSPPNFSELALDGFLSGLFGTFSRFISLQAIYLPSTIVCPYEIPTLGVPGCIYVPSRKKK